MPRSDTAIDPKPIISLMYAVSVGFWARELSNYVLGGTKADPEGKAVEAAKLLENASQDFGKATEGVQNEPVLTDALAQAGKVQEAATVAAAKVQDAAVAQAAKVHNAATAFCEATKDATDEAVKIAAEKIETAANTFVDAAVQVAAAPVQDAAYFTMGDPDSYVTLVSGSLFLIDLLCIVWWYARYVYRIQPAATFWMYFLDFLVCSMFAFAANTWTKPVAFLFATILGSGFLLLRFWCLYGSPDASLTDKRIMRTAGYFLLVAVAISCPVLLVLTNFNSADAAGSGGKLPVIVERIIHSKQIVPGLLAAIGIALTWFCRKRIEVAVDIYTAQHEIKPPAPLRWPSEGVPTPVQRILMREQTKAGLDDFELLFARLGKHDRIHSRVHAESDLRIQSYILSLPSCQHEDFAIEMRKKAFMVAVSHWLDDLVDGRNEDVVYQRLVDGPKLSGDVDAATELFRHVYQPLIVRYTDKGFYDHLFREINEACPMAFNQGSMLLGLNRVAYGAVLFSPRIPLAQRWTLLRNHNVFLKEWNVERDIFTYKVECLLNQMSSGVEAGSILLGLTTKTVQEVAMSSENHQLNVGLSILFSILYAPLIYYHNVVEEVRQGEMTPLQAFDIDYDLWVDWIGQVRTVIDSLQGEEYQEDVARMEARSAQIAMAYQCFKKMLPDPIHEELRRIYLPESNETQP